jgi:hypothetical protein
MTSVFYSVGFSMAYCVVVLVSGYDIFIVFSFYLYSSVLLHRLALSTHMLNNKFAFRRTAFYLPPFNFACATEER